MNLSRKIHILSDDVANKIAAGETIRRPSSALKELLENSLDAGSTTIKVVVEDGGKTLLQVVDNGSGMHELDARLCFEPHATSKIVRITDLENIVSYGFRGEAMSSLAAVAEIELITRRSEDEVGTSILIENSSIRSQESVRAPLGTQVQVRYLFRHWEVRRKQLKSNVVEMRYLVEEFQRIALARPDVAFLLQDHRKELYNLPVTKQLGKRIVHLLGPQYQKQLIPCEDRTVRFHIKGYIGTPQNARKTRGDQFFFVNKRFFKSPYLEHAIKKAFDWLLPPKRFPFYVLFITVPPHKVNVNVHPMKTEVKFEQEQLLYTLLLSAVKRALATQQMMHSIDFNQSTDIFLAEQPAFKAPLTATSAPTTITPKLSAIHTTAVPPLILGKKSFIPPPSTLPTNNTGKHALKSLFETAPFPKSSVQWQTREGTNTVLQLQQRYILTEVKSGLLLIDQQAAHERILYERNLKALREQQTGSQKLLFPYQVELPPADIALLKACKQNLYALGFQFVLKTAHLVEVTGHPTFIKRKELPNLLMELLEQYKTNATQTALPTEENWARALAKRARLAVPTPLNPQSMERLVRDLLTCAHPYHTPSGQPTCRIISLAKLHLLLNQST